jgi:hypothetical protein
MELHDLLGNQSSLEEGFEDIWRDIELEVAGSGVAAGTGHDADPSVAEAIWCLLRSLRPSTVVERGWHVA